MFSRKNAFRVKRELTLLIENSLSIATTNRRNAEISPTPFPAKSQLGLVPRCVPSRFSLFRQPNTFSPRIPGMTALFGPELFSSRVSIPPVNIATSFFLPPSRPISLRVLSRVLASRGTQQGPVVYLNGYWVAWPTVSRPNKPKLTQSHASCPDSAACRGNDSEEN